MPARDPFGDGPGTVSPVLASFLRAYNEILDRAGRRDLYEAVERCARTAGPESVELLRAQRLVRWGNEQRRRGRFGRLQEREVPTIKPCTSAARYAVASISELSAESHLAVLALVDELIAMGSQELSGARASSEPERCAAAAHADHLRLTGGTNRTSGTAA